MSKLANVPQIDQKSLRAVYSFAVKARKNILVLGPSGAGKTDMAFQAASENGVKARYWNMSTMERPDIQGVPVISADKKTVSFAAQEGLPFKDIDDLKKERLFNDALENLDAVEHENKELFRTSLLAEIAKIKKNRCIVAAQQIQSLVPNNPFLNESVEEGEKVVLILDEIDKTPPENLQPLLELLLYHTINGRALNIQSIIMTGNLPDEQAYGEPLSHALTNRAMIFELTPDINIWLKWARDNDVHPLILGFLSKEEHAGEFFNKRPQNNQMYSYAYPSPRSWARASDSIKEFESNSKEYAHLLSGDVDEKHMRQLILSSIIGQEASEKLDVYFSFYKQYDELIEGVFDGKNFQHPKEVDALFVICIALTNKFLQFAKKHDTKKVHEKAKHVFPWISAKCVPADVRVCALRASFDSEVYVKHGIDELPESSQVFSEVVKMLNIVQGNELEDELNSKEL